jgi:hypothetical chaperone protein
MQRYFGLDFGTTNSSLAMLDDSGSVRVARFGAAKGFTESFRSVLYFERPVKSVRRQELSIYAGPSAITKYLDSDPKGRLIQSIKSFAPSRHFRSTSIFGHTFTYEDLVANIIKEITLEAQEQFGPIGRAVTVGRPVRFAGARTPEDEVFAMDRIKLALMACGFEEITFEYEPVGAAYYYESTLDHDELVLIGDFGGGTSDFSLLRVGPTMRSRPSTERILGNDGVGIAGDTFDASIVRHLVSPRLGEGTTYLSGTKVLPVPSSVYRRLERWHHLSFLKTGETLRMLRSVRATASAPDQISALLYLIENDLGYQLHSAVQATKASLSEADASGFDFADGDVHMAAIVHRSEFESWISAHLHSIGESVSRLLNTVGLRAIDVDRVFLTGGSSFVPAVRSIFVRAFGANKVVSGAEFTSVATGLALRAAHPTPSILEKPAPLAQVTDDESLL